MVDKLWVSGGLVVGYWLPSGGKWWVSRDPVMR